MATVYLSPRLGRAVVVTADGFHYLLDVESGEAAIQCSPTVLELLQGMASDLSREATDEPPPFARTYHSLERAWRRERTTTLVLLALDGQMSDAVRSTAANLANDLLLDREFAFAARARLSSAPLSTDVDFEGVPDAGEALREFASLLRQRQAAIRLASEMWARARVRVVEYYSWAAELRETTVRLGGFLAMSEALDSGRTEDFDAWLTETLSNHPQAASSDLLRMLLAWKDEAPVVSVPNEPELAVTSTPPDQAEVATIKWPVRAGMSGSPDLAPAARVQNFLEALRTGALPPSEILSRFVDLAPSWLQAEAESQDRSLVDVVSDLFRAGPINLAGAQELAKQQERFPGLREVWVLARHPLDLEETFYTIVRHNISEHFVEYYYFLPDTRIFDLLRERLIRDIGDQKHVDSRIHCIKVPSIVFAISQGIGLLIPDDIENMTGVTVTALTPDGKIEQAQEMPPSQARWAYLELRPLVEGRYGRILPRFANEPSITNPAWADIDKQSITIQ